MTPRTSAVSPPPSAFPRSISPLYRKFVQPLVKRLVTPQMAESMRNLHPLRLQYEAFSAARIRSWPRSSPLAEKVERGAQAGRRRTIRSWRSRSNVSKQIVHALDSWRDSQEALSEAIFLAVYGSPALQAAVGIDPQSVAVAAAGDVGQAPRDAGGPDRRAEIAGSAKAACGKRRFAACSMSGRRGAWWTSAASKRCATFAATTRVRG